MKTVFHSIVAFVNNVAQLLVLNQDAPQYEKTINIMPDTFTDADGRTHAAYRFAELEKGRYVVLVEHLPMLATDPTTYILMFLRTADFIHIQNPSGGTTYRAPSRFPAILVKNDANGMDAAATMMYEFFVHGSVPQPDYSN